jgi:hypothetical protein
VKKERDGMGGVYCENIEVARLVPSEKSTDWKTGDSTRKAGVMPSPWGKRPLATRTGGRAGARPVNTKLKLNRRMRNRTSGGVGGR